VSEDPDDARQKDALHRSLVKLLRNEEDVKDIIQEAHAQYLASPKAQAARKPFAYLWVIASHLAANLLRRKRKSPVLFDSPSAEAVAEELLGSSRNPCDDLINEKHLEDVIQKIDEPYRTVVLMKHCDGLSHQQIADRTGYTLSTVHTYVARGAALARKAQWK
jgi:RNA polymerase sigma factor (sigma-70 family)